MPLRRLSVCVLSRDSFRRRVPSARSCHAPRSVRPRCFSQPRRFIPRHTEQVCCTLLPAMGFATFQAAAAWLGSPSRATASSACGQATIPSGAQPFEAFPSPAAPVASPRPMPSRRCRSHRHPLPTAHAPKLGCTFADESTSGPCSAVESVASSAARTLLCCPMLPWVFPSEVAVSWRLTWTCGGRPRLRRLHTFHERLPKEPRRGQRTSPDGQLVSSRPSPPRSRRSCGVVGRASTGLAGMSTEWFHPHRLESHRRAEALLCSSAGRSQAPKRPPPAHQAARCREPKPAASHRPIPDRSRRSRRIAAPCPWVSLADPEGPPRSARGFRSTLPKDRRALPGPARGTEVPLARPSQTA